MIRYVIDASAAAEYLLRTNLGLKITDVIEGADLVAPELLDVEVISVLRRAVLQGRLDERRASFVLEDLIAWHVERIPHVELIRQAWRHRRNVTAYDSFYVALARVYDVPLITADGPLSRAPGLGIVVQNIRGGN